MGTDPLTPGRTARAAGHLHEPTGRGDARLRRATRSEQIRPATGRLLEHLGHSPAVVLGRRLDILAWNPTAAALYMDFASVPVAGRNWLRLMFTDPTLRSLHLDWACDARDAVAALQDAAAADLDDPELALLVGELSIRDTEFSVWWAEPRVPRATCRAISRYRHPLVGNLTLHRDIWRSPDPSGQRLMVLSADPGSPSHEALRSLAS